MDIKQTGILESRVATVIKKGHEVVNLSAGKSIKIETSPQGDELLNAMVPSGKEWAVSVWVTIHETDA